MTIQKKEIYSVKIDLLNIDDVKFYSMFVQFFSPKLRKRFISSMDKRYTPFMWSYRFINDSREDIYKPFGNVDIVEFFFIKKEDAADFVLWFK